MATYYIRISGSDSNAGTSPSAAWRTLTKALGAAGIASGDTLYIGAGIYREVTTVSMTSATVETFIIGDTDGKYTGDAGEVRITAFTTNDESPPTNTALINLNGRDFLTFRNLSFWGPHTVVPTIISATTANSTNISFNNCSFSAATTASSRVMLSLTTTFGVASDWLIDGCSFFSQGGTTASPILITLTTGSGSDYDSRIIIRNCIFHGSIGTSGISITSSGTSAQEGGNVLVTNCTFLGCNPGVSTSTTRVGGSAFTLPVIVRNCLIHSSTTGLSAGELGALVENHNIIFATTARTNVNIGPQSISDLNFCPLLNFGNNLLWGDKDRLFASPMVDSPLLGHGDRTVAKPTDYRDVPMQNGGVNQLFAGITSSVLTQGIINDTTKTFGNSSLVGRCFKILDGSGAGQIKTIKGNTNTTISGDGDWQIRPDASSRYIVYAGQISSTSIVSTGSNITLRDNLASWGNNFWQGYTMYISSGAASGQTFIVSGNSNNILTGYSTLSISPTSGDLYSLYWGSGSAASGIDYIHCPAGAMTYYNSAIKDSGNINNSTPFSLKFFGPGHSDFFVPVDSALTNLSVRSYFDSFYSGARPYLIVKDGAYISVSDNTGANNGAVNTWNTISLSFTPSGKGVITARLQSNATGIGGSCYFDDLVVA